MSGRHERDDAVRKQAAELIIEDETGSAARDARQQLWLLESPEHVEEHLRMDALWGALADPELADSLYTRRPQRRWSRLRRALRPRSLAAAAALIVAAGVLVWWLAAGPDVYRTAVGEVTSFQLEDRSVVSMNADSELVVDYTRVLRRVELRSGEAAFDVSRDEQRPFIVDTDRSRVVVLGTEFVVRKAGDRVEVTVLEGHVRVEPRQTQAVQRPAEPGTSAPDPEPADRQAVPDDVVELTARQKVTVGSSGAVQLATVADDEQPVAWRQRRLVFSSDRLEDVAREFNRFNADAIQVSDPGLRELRIGGVFEANDPDSLVAFLESLDGVAVRRAADGTVIVSRSD